MKLTSNLDKVNAELFDLSLALHLHIDPLTSLGEQKVERVKVNLAVVPLNLICAAHA